VFKARHGGMTTGDFFASFLYYARPKVQSH
jgi:hypothetical protein